MPSATRNLFEKRFLDLQKLLFKQKFCGVQGRFFKRAPGRRVERAVNKGYTPVVLAAPVIRGHVRRLAERFLPNLTVLSPNEISPGVEVRAIETVEVR